MIRIKAPGRICLFGEHQDYLEYPVIAMAISKYIYLEATRIPEEKFIIELPNIDDHLEILLNNVELKYHSKRDYIRSGYNQFLRQGTKFNKGYKITITGDIPINAGASSSSALVIAWLKFLETITKPRLDRIQLANMAYQTEVAEFGEAGGKMDFFTSSFGYFIYLEPHLLNPVVEPYDFSLNGFVLGNSLEKKETVNDLRKVKTSSIESFNKLSEIKPDFNKFGSKLEEIKQYLPSLSQDHQKKVIGNIINRDITQEARKLIKEYSIESKKDSKTKNSFYHQLGMLLNKHQEQLRENIGISTKKIDEMINISLESGAFGAKINGSGFGGTMFALTRPGNENNILESLNSIGTEPFRIKTSEGAGNY